jgi:hypothetical protein
MRLSVFSHQAARVAAMVTALGAALTLIAPAPALAANPPHVFPVGTNLAYSTTKTTAVAQAVVFTEGLTTTYHVAWGLASTVWCTSEGSSGSPEHESTPVEVSSIKIVEVELTGLESGKEYCVEGLAENAAGNSHSEQSKFIAGAPTAVALEVEATGETTAIFAGLVVSAQQTTHYMVGYAPVKSEWCVKDGKFGSPEHTSPSSELAASSGFKPVKATLESLTRGEEYCAILLAENETSAAARSQELTFVAGAPSVVPYLGEAPPATTTTFSVPGNINPAGQRTEYWAEYALAGSQWCQSGGEFGAPEHSTAPKELAPSTEYVTVAVEVFGLSPGTEYCAELVARNNSAPARGFQEFFATKAVQAVLTVVVAGTGSGRVHTNSTKISCPGTCSATYNPGSIATLNAEPAPGSTFAGWGGACAGTGKCNLAMNSNKTVTATFTSNSEGVPPSAPTNPPVQKGKPVVNAKTGEIAVEYEFPEPGQAESYGEVRQGATLARVYGGSPSATPAKAKKCGPGHVRKGKRCVSNAPVRYGLTTFAVAAAGTETVHLKPSGKVLAALRKGRSLNIRVTLVFTPAGTTDRVTESTSVKLHVKRKGSGRK